MVSNRKCPICGNDKNNKILWSTREILPEEIILPKEVIVTSCCVCGTCYSDTPASMEEYDNYYQNNNIYASRSPKISTLENALVLLVDNFLKKEDTILDMGFGGGNIPSKTKGYGIHQFIWNGCCNREYK